jgi:hypothetical protein
MKPKHYVNNTDFLNALIEYKLVCKKAEMENTTEPLIPNYIGECFLKIANHLSRKPNFVLYSFREEMVGDGIENCIMYFRNFDPIKSSNPFAYFTQIIYFAFLRRIQKEKKQMYVKYKATEQSSILHDGEYYEDVEGNMKQFALYDNLSEFIQTYEAKRNEKKITKLKVLDKFLEDSLPEILNESLDNTQKTEYNDASAT